MEEKKTADLAAAEERLRKAKRKQARLRRQVGSITLAAVNHLLPCLPLL
jgi:hypothetical protein